MRSWFKRKQIDKKRDLKKKILETDCFKEKEVYRNIKFVKEGRKEEFKRGSTVITDAFILIVSLLIITVTTMFMVNILTPFIYYQKLQMTAQKYMYVIEKYGSLTSLELNQMYKELEDEGFKREKLNIYVPSKLVSYGEEIIFEVKYIYNQKVPTLDGGITMKDKDIPLNIKKVSIAKK